MLVIRNAAQVVCVGRPGTRVKRGSTLRDPVLLENGSIIVHGTTLDWVGPTRDLPPLPPDADILDATGKVVLPGFVDSHTHLLFAGSRADEFERRLQGATYQQIAAAGGGINATVRCVRQASREQLRDLARPRLERLLRFGVTTVEVKSGYGLNIDDELKSLQAIADLNAEGRFDLVPTFLGAHDVPPEFQHDRAGYLRLIGDDLLPEVVRCGLAEFCDIFCETGVFGIAESAALLHRASALGLHLKIHADELTPLGGAELAAQLGAASADHLLCVTDAGIAALARSATVATLLPGTAFFLGLPYAPARQLIDGGAAVALASDCNPGTNPTENLPLVGTMACTQMKMLPAEAVAALTLNAAAALRRSDRIGSLVPGKQADLIVCDVSDYRQLFYHYGVNHVWRVVKRGRVVYAA